MPVNSSACTIFFILATSVLPIACIRVPRAVPELPAGEWVTRQGDSRHTPFLEETVPEQVRIVWEEELGRGLPATPIINDGLVISVVSGGGVMTASEENGDVYWSRRFNGSVAGQVLRIGNLLFFATSHRQGSAYALDVRRGRRLWERDLDARAVAEPAYADSMLYVPTDRGEVQALHAATGKVEWVTRLNRVASQAPLVHGESIIVLAGRQVIRLARTNGTVQRRDSVAGPPSAPPALSGDTLYIVTHDGTVAAYADLGARELWRHHIGATILAPPAVSGGAVFVLTRDADLFEVTAAGARRLVDLDGAATESLTLTAAGALIGMLDGTVTYVRRDGSIVWRQEVEGSVRAPVAVHDGAVYVATLNGTLVKLGQ